MIDSNVKANISFLTEGQVLPEEKIVFHTVSELGNYNRVEDRNKVTTYIDQGIIGRLPLMQNKITKELVTMKVIDKTLVKNVGELKLQIKDHYKLVHENVLRVKVVVETKSMFTLILEHAKYSSLSKVVKKEGCFSEHKAFVYFTQMCNALNFLYKQKKMDWKLSSSSVLVSAPKQIKLSGLDYFNQLAKNNTELDCDPPETDETEKGNIWRLGIVLYEMIHGYTPFKDKVKLKLLGRILKRQLLFPKELNEDLKDLITWTLTEDAEFRPSLNEVLGHKWLQRMRVSSLSITQPKGESTADVISEDEVQESQIQEIVDEHAHPIHQFLAEEDLSEESYEEEIEVPLDILYNYGESKREINIERSYLDTGNLKTTTRVVLQKAKSLVQKQTSQFFSDAREEI
jgi:serine/threonine protein kinase